MSSQIPPLVCHTPPPDFGDEEDDLPDDDDEQDDFDDYGSTGLPAVASTSNLPTPIPPAFSDGESAPVTPAKVPAPRLEDVLDDEDDEEIGNDSHSLELPVVVTATEAKAAAAATPRLESPPSLILSQHNFSENDLPSEDDQDDEEFQDFAFHPAPEEDVPPTGAEDNLSIPSLHLDTELSKSTTPVQLSENEVSERNLSPQEDQDPVEGREVQPEDEDIPAELTTTPVVAEDLGCRFDDNTENDFTDFTTASNDARSSAVLEIPTANDVSFDDDFAQLESTPSADSNFVSGSRTTDFATFDADFSKFDSFQASFPATFDEPVVAAAVVAKEETLAAEDAAQDDFDDFQEFAKFPTGSGASFAQPTAKEEVPVEEDDDDDDDDFGDFSDFKQSEVVVTTPVAAAPSVSIPTSRSALFRSDSILAVITGMFPSVATPEEEQSDTGQKDGGGGGHIMAEDKICLELRDMDSTLALSYQYNSSESNKALVRALGIDSRNILFGPKWNSSMPRFAANLSFSPLEPIKPTSQAQPSSSAPSTASVSSVSISSSNSSVIPMTGKQEAATVRHHAFGLDPLQPPISAGAVPGTVPAVHFDWNSAGLVNPLEGVQEILQEGNSGSGQQQQQQQQSHKNGPKGQVLDPKVPEDASPAAADEVEEQGVVDNGEEDDFEFVAAVGSSNSSSSSSSVDPPASIPVPPPSSVVRTIKLPETHIFTPSKGVNPVSRDSTDRTAEVFGEEVPVVPVVREYHDVEYSLEKTSSRSGTEKVLDAGAAEEFSEFQTVKSVEDGKGGEDQRWSSHLAIGSEFNFQRERKEKVSSYSKPVFGRSPTEELEQMDDEFSDFQAAVPVATPQVVNKPLSQVQEQQVNRSATSSPLLLSPSILLPQQTKPVQSFNSNRITQINWPDPGIDADELARFEAAFPTPKVSSIPTISSNHSSPKHSQSAASSTAPPDDDEWTDFVYSKPAPEKPSPTHGSKPSSQHQQEEWTDFIYSTPSSQPQQQSLSSSQNKFNFQNSFASGPKFSSWNSPQLPPPQFNSWNSSSSAAPNNYYGQLPNKVPTFPPTSGAPPTSHQRLPELSFITPNSTPSAMPTVGAGTKPMTHSFLSNVISSSNFTKK